MTRSTGTAGSAVDLVLDGVSKTYADFTAVHAMDLAIPAGSFFALLGSSGCGKTTTLRMAAGLEKPSTGRILLDDQDVTKLPPYRRHVNTVFQSYALFPNMDVFDNVAFGPRRRGIKDVGASVTEILEMVQLTPFTHRKPAQLSGGQQQRVAIARALINQPGVLLLDEPLGALDLKLRRQMQLELKRIQSEVGITFLHVTHDQEEAMTMADTIAVMNSGRIEQMGAPADLYDNPRSVFVANFLGQSNLVPGRIEGRGAGEVEVSVAGTRLGVPAERCHAEAGDVWVGIRPERMWIAAAGAADAVPAGSPQAAGTVEAAVFNGVSTQYSVRVPAWERVVTVFQQNTGAQARLVPGAEVEVGWAAAQGVVLDAAQGAEAGQAVDEVEKAAS